MTRVFSSPAFSTVPSNIPVKDLSKRSLTSIPEHILSNDNLNTLYLKYNDLESIDGIESLSELKVLDLSFNKLKVFPENLHKVTTLEELYVSDNFITKITSNSINSLNNLTILTLNGNNFSDFPKSVCLLNKLKTLDLSYNSITSVPKQISDMTSLVNLNLKYNKISRLTRSIGKLNELKILNLQNNEIQSIPTSYFELSNLEQLNVSFNKIESLPAIFKSGCSLASLKVFDIRFNQINLIDFNIEESEYSVFPSIEEFICDRNQLDEIPDILYYHFVNINQLILKDNHIKHISENISYLINLSSLDLSLNEIETIPQEIMQLTTLKALNLYGNNISSMPLFSSSLKQLEYLNVGYNKLKEIQFDMLERLEELILSGNPIESLQDDFISKLPNLIILYSNNMKLKQIPDDIGLLKDLDTIDFSFNQLSSIPISFSQLTNLRSLSFSHNQLINTDKREKIEDEDEDEDEEFDEWDCNQYWLEFIHLQYIDFSNNMLKYIPKGLEPFIGTHCIVLFDNNPLNDSSELFEQNFDTSNPRYKLGISEMVGRRANMEDALCIKATYSDNASLFALFDGHAGAEAAIWAADNLPDFIKGKLPFDDPKKCFDDIFFVMNEELKSYLSYFNNSSARYCGTTAVIALVIENRLIIANVGDSRAILNTGERLTVDHKPRNEIERIMSHKGGYIEGEDGGRINGTIAVSRSLGDFFMHPWVSYEPYVKSINLTEKEEYLILACDGVWDEVSDEKAIEIVDPLIKEGEIELAAIKLRDTAYALGSDDNISVVIVKFNSI